MVIKCTKRKKKGLRFRTGKKAFYIPHCRALGRFNEIPLITSYLRNTPVRRIRFKINRIGKRQYIKNTGETACLNCTKAHGTRKIYKINRACPKRHEKKEG
ncbi:hypothetical protein GGTG_05156 [Gaeumannomyces tritici R3-111a-1]|uniref:Uncharacterized protein n=1 Tax=Gaeumannomyces tritici (strain R3-111a-1) TaxID=644352 RepID=J3NV44_GAET3|nr:hypothetical protein GGTG_05156 [Gaeumannomyces tritici R3-111a-1]EJT75219.1 hypothetical protein GGTG_05156 [Gaeumannomyces tritici R3-111a-1]